MNLMKMFEKQSLDTKSIAKLLGTSPEALSAFEDAYRTHVLEFIDDENLFDINSRQAESLRRNADTADGLSDIIERIASELIAQTQTFTYDPEMGCGFSPARALPADSLVTCEEVNALPVELRPRLTGSSMCRDINGDSGAAVLNMLSLSMRTRNPKLAKEFYHHFRQGLDILDIDPLLYQIIGTNKNSMGYWLPKLAFAVDNSDEFFKIPKTKIAKVPMTLLQLTRLDYASMTESTLRIVDAWAKEIFDLDANGDYFVKTGTYSSKFDFRNARVTTPAEVAELGRYLLYIHFQALQMASPLCQPCIYGVSTTNEWVVRDFIHDPENNPTIYKGLPLRCEYRAFLDCDKNKILSIVPYWDENVMTKRFAENRDGHDIHDAVIFESCKERLRHEFEAHVDEIRDNLTKILPDINLEGQWSLDIMQNGNDFYLIDMALAENSAFYDSVPMQLRRPTPENWLPEIK